MSKKFIKAATQAVATGAGAVGAGFIAQKLTFIPKNLHGVIFTAVGIVGEAYVKNETAKSAMRGISTFGVIRLSEDMLLKNQDIAGVAFEDLGYIEEPVGRIENNAFGEIDLGEIDLGELELEGIDDDFAGVDDEFGELELEGIDEDFAGVDDEFGEIDLGEIEDFAGVEDIY